VDLWGVVHDGDRPFPGVVETLRELSSAGRRVIFLTNTSRTSPLVAETLCSTMGIGNDLYETVISSGDVTREALLSRDPPLFDLLPELPRFAHIGAPSFVPWLFELGLPFVDDLAHADLVVATGTVRDEAALATLREHLAPAAARGVPLVCTNPDPVIPRAGSTPTLGPGAVAGAYVEPGGRVFLYGKPHAPIYAAARRQLGSVAPARVLAIGDLLETDIRGARNAGLASVLVTDTGIWTAAGITPDMVLTRFAW